MNAVSTARIIVTDDSDADTSYLDQEGLGFEDRREAYHRGDFGFVGLYLEADVLIPYGADSIISTIRTPGLWSIESDSGESYFRSVAHDEYTILAEMLRETNSATPVNIDPDIRYR